MSKRLLLAGLAAVAIATPAFVSPAAAQQCLNQAEQHAFHVRALQSQMMVAMLQCGQAQEDGYRTFITRYKPQIDTAFRDISAHYRRTGGARWQPQMDAYVTTLANVHSQDGIRQGSLFCRNVAPIFQQVLAQPTDMRALSVIAQQNGLSNPHGRSDCGGASSTPAAAPAAAPRGRNRSAEAGTVRTASSAR